MAQLKSAAAAAAVRSFLARVADRPDGAHAIEYAGDLTPTEAIYDQAREIGNGDLKGLSGAEIVALYEHAHRLFCGDVFLPSVAKLRASDMEQVRAGMAKAFARRGASVAWVQQRIQAQRYRALFLWGTTDGLAREESLPTFDAPSPELLLGRMRAAKLLMREVAPIRWKIWEPLAQEPDIVDSARRVLTSVEPAPSPRDYTEPPYLGKLAAILMLERSPASIATLIGFAARAPDLRVMLEAHLFHHRDLPELAPVVAAAAT